MIKKVKVTKLRPGMFVHDFNCSWFKHPFLWGKARISDQRMIDKIVQHGIKEVYIDTSKGLDVRESDLGKGLIREIQAQLSAARYGQQPASPIASSEKLVFDDETPEARLQEPVPAAQAHQAAQEELTEAQAEAAPVTTDEPSPAAHAPVEAPPEAPSEAPAEVPVEVQEKAPPPEAPAETQAEAPQEAKPETPAETQAEAPQEAEPETPVEAEVEAPVEAEPEAPAEAEVEAPVEAEPEVPAEAQVEAPVEAEPETPTEAQAEATQEAQPEAPAEVQAEAPEEAEPEAPVEVPTEVQEKVPAEAHAQAHAEPEPGDNGQAPEAAAPSADTAPPAEPPAREAQAEEAPARAEAPQAPEGSPPPPEDAPSAGQEAPAPKRKRRLAPRVTLPETPQAEGDNGRGPAARQVQAQETAPSDEETEMPDDLGAGATMPKTVALEEEIEDAARIRSEAKQIVQKVLEDAKLGKQIQMEKVHPMVGKIVDSVLRNPDALLTLSTIKKADDFTYMHSLSVCVLMACFASSFHLSRDKVVQAGVGALLHDVGKVKVPPEILHKAGKLTEEEEAKLRSHVEHGYNILSKAQDISPIVLEIATQHHENHDGTGYPSGLKGDEISIFGQAAAVVNMYDILTSDRWWRKGMEPTEALSKLLGWSKFRFNEDVVHRFVRCIGIYPIGTLVRMESGLLGVVVEQGGKDLLHPVVRTIYDTKRQWFTKPRDIDLSNSMGKSISDRIVCHESPDKWKIKPQAYLAGQMQGDGSLSRRLKGVALNA